MKCLIVEVFDDKNKSVEALGFVVDTNGGKTTYSFKSNGHKYTVIFDAIDIPPSDLADFLSKYQYLDNKTIIEYIEYSELQTAFSIASINLSGPSGVESTGLNNFGEVYSRMIVAAKDYLTTHTPDMVHFVGYEDKMNLVYNRMSKQMLEGPLDQHDKYSRIDNKLLMRNEFIKNHTTEALIGNLDNIQKDYTNYMANIRATKNQRNQEIATKKEVGTLYKGGKGIYLVLDVVEQDGDRFAKLVEVYNKSGDVSERVVKKMLPLNNENIVDPGGLRPGVTSQIMVAMYEYGASLVNTPNVKHLKKVLNI